MTKLTEILNNLGISKIKFYWTAIFGGLADLANLIVDAFTKLLQKAKADKLKKYSTFASNVAKFIRYGVELFVTDEKYRTAGMKTADAVDLIATHISDGTYDKDELDKDVDAVKAAIDAWVNVK